MAVSKIPRICEWCNRRFVGKGLRFCSIPCSVAARYPPIDVRFFGRILKTESCWIWKPAQPGRYGYFNRTYAHRFSYAFHFGSIPPGISVLHSCDNPPCVNPEHLFLGTQLDNLRDCKAKRRHQFGMRHHGAILTDDEVYAMRAAYYFGEEKLTDLALFYGVAYYVAHNAVTGLKWSHLPMP